MTRFTLCPYTTLFRSAPLTDPKGATISYDGAPDPVIGGTEIWALAKDGATGHYLWNISGWNGTEALIMSGLYPNQGDRKSTRLNSSHLLTSFAVLLFE